MVILKGLCVVYVQAYGPQTVNLECSRLYLRVVRIIETHTHRCNVAIGCISLRHIATPVKYNHNSIEDFTILIIPVQRAKPIRKAIDFLF